MLHRTYSPDDFNTHGMLRLPWVFWLVLILQAKTWFYLWWRARRASKVPICWRCFIPIAGYFGAECLSVFRRLWAFY